MLGLFDLVLFVISKHVPKIESSSAAALASILSKKMGDISEISMAKKLNLQTKKLNDQVLRVMQSLGIDPNRTAEVILE